MLASSSRRALEKAQRQLVNVTSEAKVLRVRAAPCQLEHRRHASTAFARSTPRSRFGLTHGPYEYESDHRERVVHSPLANYNMRMATHLDHNRPAQVMALAKGMKDNGIKPDRTTYNSLLRACALEGLYYEARAIFDDMINVGIQPDRQSFHHIMETLSSNEQHALFEILKMMEEWSIQPNERTYEIIISRFAENQRLELALQFLAKIGPAGLSPTLGTATAVILAAARLGYPRLALDLADSFESTSVRRLEANVWVDLLGSCVSQLYADGTRRTWHKVVNEFNLLPDEGCCIQVLNTAARHGLADLALEVIEALKRIHIVWCEHHVAPVIEAMCYHGDLKEAFMMLDYMRKNDINHNLATAQPILEVIKKDADAVDDAWAKLESIKAEGHDVDVVALNVVIQAAVQIGDLQRAIGTYKAASTLGVTPDIDTYNVLLLACIGARHRQLGDRILSDMKEAGIKPDQTTYVHVIRLCLTQSTYEDAFFYLEEMKARGMVPPLRVYDTIIRKLVAVGDTRYKLALEELKECGYEVPVPLQSFISSGGVHSGPEKLSIPPTTVVL